MRPDAAGGGEDRDALALAELGARAQQVPGAGSLENDREGLRVADAVGDLPHERRVGDCPLRVPAAVEEGDDALALRRRAHDLPARHQRELGSRQVAVLGLVGVGPVDSGREYVEDDEALGRLRIVELPEHEHLRTTELGDLDRAHRKPA